MAEAASKSPKNTAQTASNSSSKIDANVSASNPDNKLAKKSKKPAAQKNKGGRPRWELSVRSVARYVATKDPKVIETAVKNAFKILEDKDHPNFVRMIDWLTKVMGGYDPVETKDVTPQVRERPFKGLTAEQISQFLGEKK